MHVCETKTASYSQGFFLGLCCSIFSLLYGVHVRLLRAIVLSFFFWPMYYLPFYLHLLIAPLVFFKTFLHALTMSDIKKIRYSNIIVVLSVGL